METRAQINTLVGSVSLAKTEMEYQKLLINEYFDRIKYLPKNQLTKDEKKVLKIVEMSNDNLPMINLFDAINHGGTGLGGFPNLAIATYNMSMRGENLFAKLFMEDGRLWFSGDEESDDFEYDEKIVFDMGMEFFQSNEGDDRVFAGETCVPLVPPELRQPSPKGIYVLFEVPKWNIKVLNPIDPYLLKHVAGNVFAIIGSWDLTQKELDTYRAIHF